MKLAGACELVQYTQRGVEPSATSGPFTVERHVADAVAMLDAAGWDRAWGSRALVGWLTWPCTSRSPTPERLPGRKIFRRRARERWRRRLCGVRSPEMFARTPPEDRDRARELDARAMAGEGTEEDALESLRMVWRAYFAHPRGRSARRCRRCGSRHSVTPKPSSRSPPTSKPATSSSVCPTSPSPC